jgi:hypothetical protein
MLKNFLSILHIYLLIFVERTKNIFHFSGLFSKVFTRNNGIKVIIVFLVGFISRIFVNHFYHVNVFLDYLNLISFAYYSCMSLFVVFIHEVVTYYELNIIPTFTKSFVGKALVFIKTDFSKKLFNLPSIKLSNLSFSNIASVTRNFLENLPDSNNREKLTIDALAKGEDNKDKIEYKEIEVKDIIKKVVLRNKGDFGTSANSNSTSSANRGLPRRINRGENVRVIEANQTAISHPASIHTEFGFSISQGNINNNPLFFTIDTLRGVNGDRLLSTPNPVINYSNSSVYSRSLASTRAIPHMTETISQAGPYLLPSLAYDPDALTSNIGISQAIGPRPEEIKDFPLYGDYLNSNFSTPGTMTPLFNNEIKVNYDSSCIPPSVK